MMETKDLILRQGSADDWQDLYHNLWSREEVFRYLFSKPSPNEDAKRFYRNLPSAEIKDEGIWQVPEDEILHGAL